MGLNDDDDDPFAGIRAFARDILAAYAADISLHPNPPGFWDHVDNTNPVPGCRANTYRAIYGPGGRRSPRRKFSRAQVVEVQAMRASGKPVQHIARDLRCSEALIYRTLAESIAESETVNRSEKIKQYWSDVRAGKRPGPAKRQPKTSPPKLQDAAQIDKHLDDRADAATQKLEAMGYRWIPPTPGRWEKVSQSGDTSNGHALNGHVVLSR